MRELSADDIPEYGRVVGFEQVRQFMDDDVIDHEHGSLNQPPIDIYVILWRT